MRMTVRIPSFPYVLLYFILCMMGLERYDSMLRANKQCDVVIWAPRLFTRTVNQTSRSERRSGQPTCGPLQSLRTLGPEPVAAGEQQEPTAGQQLGMHPVNARSHMERVDRAPARLPYA